MTPGRPDRLRGIVWYRAAGLLGLMLLAGCSELCGLAVGGVVAAQEAQSHVYQGVAPMVLWQTVRQEVQKKDRQAVLPPQPPALNAWAETRWVDMNDQELRRTRARLLSADNGATLRVEIDTESRPKSAPNGPTQSLGAELDTELSVMQRADPAGYAQVSQRVNGQGGAAQSGCSCVEDQFQPVPQPQRTR